MSTNDATPAVAAQLARVGLGADEDDAVNHPSHYTGHPSGVECITIDLKADAIEDLKKARWYIDREISRREATR